MDKLLIIKIGGNVVDDEAKLSHFLKIFAAIEENKILVHGGGKLATKLAEKLEVPQQLVEGRRITDAETLKIVTMVYAGYINKNIVAQLQAAGCNAIGLTGADGNAILAHQRTTSDINYGFAGDIDKVNTSLFRQLMNEGHAIVMSPITHNKEGQLLNTNADTIAQEIARALSVFYQVKLIYSFEKTGVLLDAADNTSVITRMNKHNYTELKEKELVFAGMIPKLDNAFLALQQGVHKVIIGQAEDLLQLIEGTKGTTLTHD
jgi:acetylglutamate kinase